VDTIGRQVTAFVTMFMAAGLIILMYMIFEPQRQAAASNHQVHTAVERGAELFAENCVVCHGLNGQGIAGAGFPLNTDDNRAPDDDRRAFLFNTIARGRQNSNGTEPNMPAFLETEGGGFNEQQVNDVITFIGCADTEEWAHVSEIVSGHLGTPINAVPTPFHFGTPNVRVLPGAPAAATPTAAASGAPENPALAIFETHCINCHKIAPEFPQGAGVGPNLTGIALRDIPSRAPVITNKISVPNEKADGLARWIRNPSAIRPGSGMPAFGTDKISDADMQVLAAWLMEHNVAGAAEAEKTCYKKTSR
jgi:mono/diheme cytochrome c family protein